MGFVYTCRGLWIVLSETINVLRNLEEKNGMPPRIYYRFMYIAPSFIASKVLLLPLSNRTQRVNLGAPVEVLRSEKYLPTNSRWTPMKHRWTFEQQLPTSTPTR